MKYALALFGLVLCCVTATSTAAPKPLSEKDKCTFYAIGLSSGAMAKMIDLSKESARSQTKVNYKFSRYSAEANSIFDAALDEAYANGFGVYEKVPLGDQLDRMEADCMKAGRFRKAKS